MTLIPLTFNLSGSYTLVHEPTTIEQLIVDLLTFHSIIYKFVSLWIIKSWIIRAERSLNELKVFSLI